MEKHTESILLHTYSPQQLERLKEIETSSKRMGMLYGLLVAASVAGGLYFKKRQGTKISLYYSGVVSLLSGLITSQMATHYLFIRGSDQIRFERRIQAALKTEQDKRSAK